MSSKKLIPLRRVVAAAIVDTYSDVGTMQQRFFHWAARGLSELVIQRLRLPVRRVLLQVNSVTNTAVLPLDFDGEIFVGYISRGIRYPIFVNRDLVHEASIEKVYDKCCPKCGEKDICEDFNVEVSSETAFVHADVTYFENTSKQIFPDGSYWLVKDTPYVNEQGDVIRRQTKDFIAKVELSDCGCVKSTEENIKVIKNSCPDIYGCYFTGRGDECNMNFGGYKIFEETGIIQLSSRFKPQMLYLEYNVFMPKVNGEYMVPAVAFETLVNWINLKSIQSKPNTSGTAVQIAYTMYKDSKGNMSRVLGRVKLSSILNSYTSLPKFGITNEI